MNFYISSRLGNAKQVQYVAGRLKDGGWTHTCDWTRFDVPGREGAEGLREISRRECEGVRAADVVLVLTPLGRGTHVELGMAIALEKRVYLYHGDDAYFCCDDQTCAFYWLPQVKRLTGELDAAIDAILSENTSNGS